MFDTILKDLFEILLCLISIAIYVFAVGSVLPSWLLRLRCSVQDRGLNKYTYPSGRGILYEPHPTLRKYVSSYILFVDNGVKYIRCKATDGVERISYSVAVFDRHGKVIEVLKTTDVIGPAGCTRRVALPKETSYVTLMLDAVNEKKIDSATQLTLDKKKGIAFGGLVVVLTVIEAFIIRAMMLKAVNLVRVYLMGDSALEISGAFVFVAAVVISAVGLGAMFLKKRKGGLKIK
ncbi:MAG: hypothetical protein E7592_00215 [Ruminococcaceae bacterium]|nr:hypothetical protein [Oscillospiraceae bacterium]